PLIEPRTIRPASAIRSGVASDDPPNFSTFTPLTQARTDGFSSVVPASTRVSAPLVQIFTEPRWIVGCHSGTRNHTEVTSEVVPLEAQPFMIAQGRKAEGRDGRNSREIGRKAERRRQKGEGRKAKAERQVLLRRHESSRRADVGVIEAVEVRFALHVAD